MQENETRSSSRNAKSARIAPSAVPTSRATFNLDIGLPTQAAEDNDETASDRARTRKR